jgi:hypothetical protein
VAYLVLPLVVAVEEVERALLQPLQAQAKLRPQLLQINTFAVLEDVAAAPPPTRPISERDGHTDGEGERGLRTGADGKR